MGIQRCICQYTFVTAIDRYFFKAFSKQMLCAGVAYVLSRWNNCPDGSPQCRRKVCATERPRPRKSGHIDVAIIADISGSEGFRETVARTAPLKGRVSEGQGRVAPGYQAFMSLRQWWVQRKPPPQCTQPPPLSFQPRHAIDRVHRKTCSRLPPCMLRAKPRQDHSNTSHACSSCGSGGINAVIVRCPRDRMEHGNL